MGLGRYVVDAVVLEGRSPTELARSHGISRTWIYELVRRFRAGGYAALAPRSRRPLSCPHQHGPKVEQRILALRASLAAAGVMTPVPRPSRTTSGARASPFPPRPRSGGSLQATV